MKLLANLASMSDEELQELHEEISKLLEAKMLAKKKKLERRLNSLQPAKTDLKARRPYPPVVPKFANPDDPTQVWSGRGKWPHWVTEKLASGLTFGDLRIRRGPGEDYSSDRDLASQASPRRPARRLSILCQRPPTEIGVAGCSVATGNDQIITGGDTAGDRVDQVVNDLDRKPMLATSNTLG